MPAVYVAVPVVILEQDMRDEEAGQDEEQLDAEVPGSHRAHQVEPVGGLEAGAEVTVRSVVEHDPEAGEGAHAVER